MSDQKKAKHRKGAIDVDEAGGEWLSTAVSSDVDELDLDAGIELVVIVRGGMLRIKSVGNIPLRTFSFISGKLSWKKLGIIIAAALALLVYFFPSLQPFVEQLLSIFK